MGVRDDLAAQNNRSAVRALDKREHASENWRDELNRILTNESLPPRHVVLRDVPSLFEDEGVEETLSDHEQAAFERIRRAGVKAPSSSVVYWIRAVGPDVILAATLSDILATANAF